jgi:hypothetical protein
MSRLAVSPSLLCNGYWGSFAGVKWPVHEDHHPLLVPGLVSGAIPLLPIYAFILWTGTTYLLTYYTLIIPVTFSSWSRTETLAQNLFPYLKIVFLFGTCTYGNLCLNSWWRFLQAQYLVYTWYQNSVSKVFPLTEDWPHKYRGNSLCNRSGLGGLLSQLR